MKIITRPKRISPERAKWIKVWSRPSKCSGVHTGVERVVWARARVCARMRWDNFLEGLSLVHITANIAWSEVCFGGDKNTVWKTWTPIIRELGGVIDINCSRRQKLTETQSLSVSFMNERNFDRKRVCGNTFCYVRAVYIHACIRVLWLCNSIEV